MDNVIEKWDEILQTVKRDYNISDVASIHGSNRSKSTM